MSKLIYEKEPEGKSIYTPMEYKVNSMYSHPSVKDEFDLLRTNVVDLNSALVTKCIQGTEQDFIMLMNKAKDFLEGTYPAGMRNDAKTELLLELFQECVFGYYVLTPLLKECEVSDIKVLAWDHITCKVNGRRYVTNLSFHNEEDYNRWFDRILRIHRLQRSKEYSLQHCTDRKGIENFYLRIDIQLAHVTSTEHNNIHIRKIPKNKYSWEYLKENGMLDDDILDYLKNRIANGFGFLISGKGGSGKSTLLNNMLDLISYDESILVSQESDELYSEHPQMQFEHTLELKKHNSEFNISLEDELRLGLLQDIDNFVIGEIKGGEALYVFTTAMNTGARFFGTIHSNNAVGSVRRLAQCARYVSDYTVESLEEMLTATRLCLIHMSYFSIDEILEVAGWDNQNLHLIFQEVYKKQEERL